MAGLTNHNEQSEKRVGGVSEAEGRREEGGGEGRLGEARRLL